MRVPPPPPGPRKYNRRPPKRPPGPTRIGWEYPPVPRTSLEPDAPLYRLNLYSGLAEPVYRLSIGHFRCLARASGVGQTHLNHQRRRLASVADEPEPNGVVRVNANQQKRVKLLSAVIGASAVVAMGAVGVIFGDVRRRARQADRVARRAR